MEYIYINVYICLEYDQLIFAVMACISNGFLFKPLVTPTDK